MMAVSLLVVLNVSFYFPCRATSVPVTRFPGDIHGIHSSEVAWGGSPCCCFCLNGGAGHSGSRCLPRKCSIREGDLDDGRPRRSTHMEPCTTTVTGIAVIVSVFVLHGTRCPRGSGGYLPKLLGWWLPSCRRRRKTTMGQPPFCSSETTASPHAPSNGRLTPMMLEIHQRYPNSYVSGRTGKPSHSLSCGPLVRTARFGWRAALWSR